MTGHRRGLTKLKGNRTGAPRSQQRTWAENDGRSPTIVFSQPCTKATGNLSVQQPLFVEPPPFPLSSLAKRGICVEFLVIQSCHLDRRSHGPAPTQANEKRLGPANALYRTVTLSLSSRPKRSGAEGPAVPRTLRGNVFRQSVPGFPATQNSQRPRMRLSVEDGA